MLKETHETLVSTKFQENIEKVIILKMAMVLDHPIMIDGFVNL